MNRRSERPSDPDVVAVLHRGGGAWRLLVASEAGDRPRIIEAIDLPPGDQAALRAALDRLQVARLVAVVPASRTIVRSTILPDAEPDHLEQALRLQAEAHLLDEAPMHRAGLGVLAAAAGETTRTGIIAAWPAVHRGDLDDLGLPVRWAPEAAALAALVGAARPADALLSVDRESGSVAIAIAHANGVLVRTTGERGSDDAAWRNGLRRVVLESALSVGHAVGFAEGVADRLIGRLQGLGDGDARLLLPAEIARDAATQVEGVPRDPAWLERWGIALGTLVAATGPLSGLTDLRDRATIEAPAFVDGLIAALSRPRTAVAVVAACIVLLGLVPVFSAGLRLLALELRHGDVAAQKAAADTVRARLAMYRELESESAWSMAKLLADIVSAAPLGIEYDSIRVSAGEGGFTVTGETRNHEGQTAKDLLNRLQEHLGATGVFRVKSVDLDEPNNYGHHTFSLAAEVLRPYYRPEDPIERDFARWTHQDRKSGEGPPSGETAAAPETRDPAPEVPVRVASDDDDPEATPPSGAGGEDEGGEAAAAPRRSHVSAGSGSGAGGVNPDDIRGESGSLAVVSEPLTAEQIAVMTRDEVLAKYTEVAKARTAAKRAGDEELEARLVKEFDLLRARLRELNS